MVKKTVTEIDEDGNKTTSTVPKRINKWFYTNNGTDWLLEIKYGNRILPLAKDKTAIVVGDLANMVAVLEQVKVAVVAKELDKAIEAALTKNNGSTDLSTKLVLSYKVHGNTHTEGLYVFKLA